MAQKIVIWGAGGHALVVADILHCAGGYELAGFLVDAEFRHLTRTAIAGQVLGGREQLERLLSAGVNHVVVALGDCRRRLEMAALLEQKGFSLATLVHPRAVVARGVEIHPGAVVAAGAIVNPGASIGANAILNTGAIVEHECRIAAGVHLSPAVRLAGHVTIGRATWIGIGATVIDRVTIGSDSMIGAGALVLADIPDRVVAYGVPAKVVRSNETSASIQKPS